MRVHLLCRRRREARCACIFFADAAGKLDARESSSAARLGSWMHVNLPSQRRWERRCGAERLFFSGLLSILPPFFLICCHKKIHLFLIAWVEAGGYYFYSTVEKRFAPETQEGFPQEYYLMEKNTGKIYKQHVVNEDVEGQDVRLDPAVIERTLHADEGVLVLQADELLEYVEEGTIKSEALSRIAESLDEDSNPVLMFLSFSGQ